MCGRVYDPETAEHERFFKLEARESDTRLVRWLAEAWKLAPHSYDVRPTTPHAVVTAQGPELMHWGFKPDWSPSLLFNARSDKIKGRAWGKAFREHRCLLPVGGFYEWTGARTARQPHAICRADGSPMLLAALWLELEGQRCFVVVTRDASAWMARLHDREPVEIEPEHALEYLTATEPPLHLLGPAKGEVLREFLCAGPFKDRPPAPVARLF